MKNQKNSKAFSLFEIVVSIVVLGIIAATFPLILQSVTQSAKTITKEETVFNEISLMSMILQYYFDENNTVGDNFYKDLNASGGDDDLWIKSYSMYTGKARVGKAEFNNNELRSGSSEDVSKIGIDSGENKNDTSTYDDIDDFNDHPPFIVNGIKLNVSVYYINDEANYLDDDFNFTYDYDTKKDKTNIKVIKISSDNGVILYYPTCNIGASKFLSLEDLSR